MIFICIIASFKKGSVKKRSKNRKGNSQDVPTCLQTWGEGRNLKSLDDGFLTLTLHLLSRLTQIKVRLSHSKKFCYISSNESPLKMIKNTFYFILKYLFVLKVIEFFSWLFGYIRKWLDQKDKVSFNIYNITTWLTSNYKTMNFVQSTRYNKRNVLFKKSSKKWWRKTSSRSLCSLKKLYMK